MLVRHSRSPFRLALAAVLAVALVAGAVPAAGGELVLETENDFLTDNPERDDLYTFAIAVGWDWGEHTLRLRENSFTDRRAGLRFDETYLTTGRQLPAWRGWMARAEAGFGFIGHGLFGAGAQNALHRVIGSDEVEISYVDDRRFHPAGRLEAERVFVRGPTLAHGPIVELQAAPGFKSSAAGGWMTEWDAPGPFAFKATAGLRFTDTEFEPLAARLAKRAGYGSLEVAFRDRFVARWSYNAYGTAREHLSVGYRIGAGRRGAGGVAG